MIVDCGIEEDRRKKGEKQSLFCRSHLSPCTPSQKQHSFRRKFLAKSRFRIPPTGGIHKTEPQRAQRKPVSTEGLSFAVFAPPREYF
jgi:hypothetical protein